MTEPEPSPADIAAARTDRGRSYLPDIVRLQPQSPDAEQSVLCSILISPIEVGALCAEKGCCDEWFFIPAHQAIYAILRELWEASRPIDFITLTQILRDRNQLAQCGGAPFITELFTFLPTAANAEYYLEICREKYILREIIKVGTRHVSGAYEVQEIADESLAAFERAVLAIATNQRKSKIAPAKEAVHEALEAIGRSYESHGEITGISTGFPELDGFIDGLHDGEVMVIAARPSQGKTALAMNIADHLAINLKLPIAVFSLEMSSQQLMQRMICSRARVNMRRVREGYLSERDFPAITAAGTAFADSKMFIDESSDLTIQELRGRARRLKNQHGIRAAFVDYLQLLHSSTKRSRENRQQEVAEVSAGLKAMAKELSIPVVVLAQINRDFDKRGPQARPRLSDLRESGAIEQDADIIAFLTRPETSAESEEQREELRGVANLIIEKNRNGPNGDVRLTFLKEFTRFESRAIGPFDDQPQEPALL